MLVRRDPFLALPPLSLLLRFSCLGASAACFSTRLAHLNVKTFTIWLQIDATLKVPPKTPKASENIYDLGSKSLTINQSFFFVDSEPE